MPTGAEVLGCHGSPRSDRGAPGSTWESHLGPTDTELLAISLLDDKGSHASLAGRNLANRRGVSQAGSQHLPSRSGVHCCLAEVRHGFMCRGKNLSLVEEEKWELSFFSSRAATAETKSLTGVLCYFPLGKAAWRPCYLLCPSCVGHCSGLGNKVGYKTEIIYDFMEAMVELGRWVVRKGPNKLSSTHGDDGWQKQKGRNGQRGLFWIWRQWKVFLRRCHVSRIWREEEGD